MNSDILNEISRHLDLKSIIMLYATTFDIHLLCDKMYWKKLYHRYYSSEYYKSKHFTLSQYKYKNSTDDTLILHRKYTDKEYVIMYYVFNQLSNNLLQPDLTIDETLKLHFGNINTFCPEFSKLFILKSLDLHGNPLTVIPSSIGNMINLKELSLSNTSINEIPKEIGLLVKLKRLFLYLNNYLNYPKKLVH